MKTLIPLLAILTLLTSSFRVPATPRYTPLDFSDMVMMSRLTVHGAIVEVKPKTFVLKVETVIKGNLEPADKKTKRLEVNRFVDWACAQRWVEYKVGQEVVLCLNGTGQLHVAPWILSGGGEGEMPVISPVGKDANSKWLVLRGRKLVEAGTEQRWSLDGVERTITAVELKGALRDLKEFHACFRTEEELTPGSRQRIQLPIVQLQPDERVEKLAKSSKLAKFLVERVRTLNRLEPKK